MQDQIGSTPLTVLTTKEETEIPIKLQNLQMQHSKRMSILLEQRIQFEIRYTCDAGENSCQTHQETFHTKIR